MQEQDHDVGDYIAGTISIAEPYCLCAVCPCVCVCVCVCVSPTAVLAQLGVMRTMGLTDDSHSIQALMATDGDVNAAVDLLMSGALS